MDIVSHGLWGGVGFGRKSKKNFWLAFFFGIAPDLFSFGIYSFSTLFGFEERVSWKDGPPDLSSIPYYVDALYNVTHSLVVFALVFAAVWFVMKKAPIVMFGWPLHIVTDIFTHSTSFFPTPFLWPFSSYRFDGISWGNPNIFIPNLALLAIVFIIWATYRKRKLK
jgi:hypothetical protein